MTAMTASPPPITRNSRRGTAPSSTRPPPSWPQGLDRAALVGVAGGVGRAGVGARGGRRTRLGRRASPHGSRRSGIVRLRALRRRGRRRRRRHRRRRRPGGRPGLGAGPTPGGPSGSAAGRRSSPAGAARWWPTPASGRPTGRCPPASPAGLRSVAHTFHRNGNVEAPSRTAPTVETRLSVVNPSLGQVVGHPAGHARRGPSTCCTMNVRWKPTKRHPEMDLAPPLATAPARSPSGTSSRCRRRARRPTRRRARSACGPRRSSCRGRAKSMGAAASITPVMPPSRNVKQEPAGEEHGRLERDAPAPHRADPVEELHAGRHGDEHREAGEEREQHRPGGEHVVRPHADRQRRRWRWWRRRCRRSRTPAATRTPAAPR